MKNVSLSIRINVWKLTIKQWWASVVSSYYIHRINSVKGSKYKQRYYKISLLYKAISNYEIFIHSYTYSNRISEWLGEHVGDAYRRELNFITLEDKRTNTVHMYVISKYLGCFIGKGGERYREFENFLEQEILNTNIEIHLINLS